MLEQMPEGEPGFPADYLTDQPERTIVAETVREKVLQNTRAELPFSTAVVVDQFDEADRERILRLYCTIYVETDSQKPIVIGRAGEMIKRIGTEARQDIEKFFGTKVFLDLRVKVNAAWRDNDRASTTSACRNQRGRHGRPTSQGPDPGPRPVGAGPGPSPFKFWNFPPLN